MKTRRKKADEDASGWMEGKALGVKPRGLCV